MSMSRRSFIVGSISGLTVLAVAACTESAPEPTPPMPSTRSDIPQPVAFQRTSWTSDPLATGAFSYLPVGATPEQRAVLREPVDGRIFFAGEHTADVGPGTVQGARVSGRRVATDVLQRAQPGERIAVVGAGLAGATAARILSDAGFEVVVIEGRERAGGRISTFSGDEWPFPIELGAAVIHDAGSNSLSNALAAARIETTPVEARVERRTRAGAVAAESDVAEDALLEARTWAEGQLTDLSIADALVESGAAELSDESGEGGISDADRLENYVTADLGTAAGADVDDLSAWFAQPVPVLAEGDELVTGDFQSFVAAELEGIDVLPSSHVSHITTTEHGVSLRLVRGESYSAERVVVTVPLGVLKAGTIEFEPPLPFSHRGAISALGMGLQDKVLLRFEKPFWSTDAAVWTVIDGDTDFPLWLNLLPATGEAILVGLTGGEAAQRLAEYGDQEVLDAALASLEPFLDPSLASPRPSSGVGG
ncbi:FAD-dependent oxidoreductase [Salinibacterium sp. SYSU T00001]|uniref:flavin monoamine oxidase family protein n=1 Tax=Homoserinimonas sedimenticola TaxID=2986805 RepID=UPI002235E2E5|nr:FAD-dependent oxidoreductase [Salinibacterium sedimenticola]MCW4384251.1 FAD-dependent oxidoreductase [Salinibacterium sedimenticola]